MKHGHGKGFWLAALSLTVALIAGAALAGGSLCGMCGCGLLCSACSAACSDLFTDETSGNGTDWNIFDDRTPEPMWDGPGSIQTTPLLTEAPTEVPTIAATEEPTETAAPSPELGTQVKAEAAQAVREKRVQLKNDGTDTVTVLVLMNGSDLESEYGEATDDLTEMVRAEKSDRVNILVETVGTRSWSARYGISSRRSERYLVTDSGLKLLDDTLGQLDTTVPGTLSDFIRWGAENYPADRYILLLWDHGGGPVYGFGYDEYQSYDSTLTIDEMQIALRDGGVYFDLIGMDCCLMSSLEVCCALYEYCDYTLLSEDFEPSIGWSHTGWLSALAKNPAIPTPDLASIAIGDSVQACEKNLSDDGGTTLALMDQAYMKLLYAAWVDFAYDNTDTLLNANYSQLRESNSGRAHPLLRSVGAWGTDDATLDDYFVTDILSVAQNIESEKSEALSAALHAAIIRFGATSDETTLTGLSVTLPYGDADFYKELKRVFRAAGFDEAYIDWLEQFVAVESNSADDFFDFGDWGDLWGGWGTADSDFDWDNWPLSDIWEDEDWTDGDWADDDWFDLLFGNN